MSIYLLSESDKREIKSFLSSLPSKDYGDGYLDTDYEAEEIKDIIDELKATDDIFILCKDTEEHTAFEILQWNTSEEELQKIAVKLEWDKYKKLKDQLEGTETKVLSPDEVSYRKYFVSRVGLKPSADT